MAGAAHYLRQRCSRLSRQSQAGVAQVVEVQLLGADLLARRLPRVVHMMGSKLAAVRSREDAGGREGWTPRKQVFSQSINGWLRKVDEPATPDFRFGDYRAHVVDLHHLSFDPQRSGGEVDVAAL